MAIQRVAVTGRADPGVVWDRFLRFERWPGWSPQIRAVESADSQLCLGASGQVISPGGLTTGFTVTEFDEQARTWSWIARVGPVAVTMHHAVEAHRRGSRVVMILDGPRWVTTAYAPLMTVALRSLVSR